ncbi:polyprenyl synthetase family protein, partial [Bacillus cereus]|uniref:polyprenyl synthetase family protein n=1 Tax=Bacillus cereus TaxID=1396 RepID=UPI0020CC9CC8|nr:polyprenyl synthetase family protein [Bacillus cereus]
NGLFLPEAGTITVNDTMILSEETVWKLLEFAVLAGSILSDATEEQEEKLLEFAKYIGLAFQIRDDILDVEGTEEEIGKPIGSDVSNEKSTYTTLFTVDRAKDILDETIAKAKDAIGSLQLQDEYLLSICDLIAKRNN